MRQQQLARLSLRAYSASSSLASSGVLHRLARLAARVLPSSTTAAQSPSAAGSDPASSTASTSVSAALRAGERVTYSFGRGHHCQLGHGDSDARYVPTRVRMLTEPLRALACGEAHTACITDSGHVWTFGWNESGQCGQDETPDSSFEELEQAIPAPLFALTHIRPTALACGARHTALVDDKGQVLAFGNNAGGQLGDGTLYNRNVAAALTLPGGAAAAAVQCGHSHTVVLSTAGDVFVCGSREKYALGDGHSVGIIGAPVHKHVPGRVERVACGGFHTLALNDAGELYAWGTGDVHSFASSGELQQRYTLVRVPLPADACRAVVCGFAHTLALAHDGTLYAWGDNQFGQLGTGDNAASVAPRAVALEGLERGERVRDVASGWFHSAAITDRGRLFLWGGNVSGCLGLGADAKGDVLAPRWVDALADRHVLHVGLGAHYTAVHCAVRAADE